MIEMSPYYAFESDVGPVFDAANLVATEGPWSLVAGALVFGLLVVAALVFVWQPTLVLEKPPKPIANIHEETLDLAKDSPWIAYGTSAVAGLIALASLATAYARRSRRLTRGILLPRRPGRTLAPRAQRARLPQISASPSNGSNSTSPWTASPIGGSCRKKQLGSMSRNVGNIAATFHIRTTDGKKFDFSLDCFREPSFVIQSKLNDAMQMVPVQFGPGDAEGEMETVPRNRSRPSETI